MTGSLILSALLAVVIGTWNGNWFPSGRAEHRAHPDVEDATITAAARMLAEGLNAVDPAGTNDVIICLNEIRGPSAASNLIARIGRPGLRVVAVSGYRRRDRFDQQQDVIATTLSVAGSSWSRWRNSGSVTPPRGYAFAEIVFSAAVTANVYAVHLKSNYGATTPEIKAANSEKRLNAITQIIKQERPKRGKAKRPVILAGDMNADRWRKEFADEKLFPALDEAGFTNPLAELPADSRGTHPSRRYGDSALDYIFLRGIKASAQPKIIPNDNLSDHYALFVVAD